ncbi:NUDIX domain-containing protein [Streptomyces sp. SID8499]|uniref:NUDIX hydrolase n=1 Tax=Streptomyces sp. SID8499 TaxID=2706106 RepID=UPI0013C8A6EC|nr:NUDIX domain-containing protein [Streptomyces sp. SID8499]NED31057.1 NUDIX domain-containing protein [Streptomyces sp. SID8499]
MDVIEIWKGQHAAALQAAMRATNEEFARQLGVAVRTVAAWHATPSTVPRREIQRALDTLLDRATPAEQRRFDGLLRTDGAAQAQALQVAIAVVVRGREVLLVCRRGEEALSWQFPAGVVKPGGSASAVAVQETLAETAVHCTVREHLGSRVHPQTGVLASYKFCEYLAGEARNVDAVENLDTAWVPIRNLTKFIPAERIYPPALKALEALA